MDATALNVVMSLIGAAAAAGAAYGGARAESRNTLSHLQRLERDLVRDVDRVEAKTEHAHDRLTEHITGHAPKMHGGG